jgi:hypothetical protein
MDETYNTHWKMKRAIEFYLENLKGRDFGRRNSRCKNNIKILLKIQHEDVNQSHLAKDRD